MNGAIWAATFAYVIGAGLTIAAVNVLAGLGWALLTAGVSFFIVCFIIVRGLNWLRRSASQN